MNEVDIDNMDLAEKYLNDDKRPYYNKFRSLFNSLSKDIDDIAQDIIISGDLCVIRAKFVARDVEGGNNRMMGIITFENISRSPYLK